MFLLRGVQRLLIRGWFIRTEHAASKRHAPPKRHTPSKRHAASERHATFKRHRSEGS